VPSDSATALVCYIKALKSSKTADGQGGGYLPALQEKSLRDPRTE